MNDTLMSTYARLPVTFQRGEGALLWDTAGKEYLDAVSGIAVCGLGHAHPGVARTLCDQAGELIHTSNLYGIERQEALGQALTEAAGMDRVFFANSGAEANEAALKLARLYGHRKGVAEPTVIVMENSFHGRTLATLSATGNRKVQAGFEPLIKGFVRVPYDDLETVENVAKHNKDIVAVLVEPIQGEGGVRMPEPGYLRGLREICDQHGWLLMLDEIQTGMGRTGRLFAFEHEGIRPDVVTLAKALGNGVPIGACLAMGEAADVFQPGNHGSTFGGNPLACAVGLTVLETVLQEGLVERSASLGDRLRNGFREALAELEGVEDIRGQGLMLGLELARDCGELVGRALDRGLLINVTAGNVVRLLPPLVLSDAQADRLVAEVSDLVKGFLGEQAEQVS